MFTDEQLAYIKIVARKQKNQGERSVSKTVRLGSEASKLIEIPGASFTLQQLDIIDFCAEECKRQRSGEMSVYDMLNAWAYASTYMINGRYRPIDIHFIETLGQWVEPIDNKNGFRTIPMGIAGGWNGHGFDTWIEKADWREVPRLLTLLLESYYEGNYSKAVFEKDFPASKDASPIERFAQTAVDMFYFEYEEIHPFRDGNGRTGKILFNYLKGTLDNPQMPPNFWGISNP
jgi:hypothetical protein